MRLAYLYEWWPADPFKMALKKIAGKVKPHIGAQYAVPAAQDAVEDEIEEVEQEIEEAPLRESREATPEDWQAFVAEALPDGFSVLDDEQMLIVDDEDPEDGVYQVSPRTPCPECRGEGSSLIGIQPYPKVRSVPCWSCKGSGVHWMGMTKISTVMGDEYLPTWDVEDDW